MTWDLFSKLILVKRETTTDQLRRQHTYFSLISWKNVQVTEYIKTLHLKKKHYFIHRRWLGMWSCWFTGVCQWIKQSATNWISPYTCDWISTWPLCYPTHSINMWNFYTHSYLYYRLSTITWCWLLRGMMGLVLSNHWL